jgi:hypothetical protein
MEVYRRLALQVMLGIARIEVAAEQKGVGVGAVIKVMGVLGKIRQGLRSIYRISDMMLLPYHTRDRTAYILNEAVKNLRFFCLFSIIKNMNM